MESDLLALHWMEHASVFSQAIGNLRTKTSYTDATLACEGHFYPVHKFVLSTCSQYFSAIFEWTPCINPVVVINNVTCNELEALLDFMYIGEVSVKESLIPNVMRAAEWLRIRGLSIVDEENTKPHLRSKSKSDLGGPPRKRKRTASSKRKSSVANSDIIPAACKVSESNGHLSPPPSLVSDFQFNKEDEMHDTEDYQPDLNSGRHSKRNLTEAENQEDDMTNTLASNNAPSNIIPEETSSSPQPHLAEQPVEPLPVSLKPNINEHSHISPPHHPTESHSHALDLSSHEHNPEASMNTVVEATKSEKMQSGEAKVQVPPPHNIVSSEEIPDILDSLVDMQPLYDAKPVSGNEVATLHAVEPHDSAYEFTEELPSASAASSQQEVQHQESPVAASSKKKIKNTTEENPDLKCSTCGKQFQKKDGLRRHMRTHNKEPYTCSHCPFTTKSFRGLSEHKKKEHASVHKCTMCEFTTHSSDHLKRHVTNHEKPHHCPKCIYRTTRLQNLRKHIRNMHEKK